MRDPNLGTISYQPGQVPDDPTDIPRFLREELDQLAASIRLLALGHIDVQFVAPVKPRRGDIRYASGAPGWNPGGGEGIYYYNGAGVWTQLG